MRVLPIGVEQGWSHSMTATFALSTIFVLFFFIFTSLSPFECLNISVDAHSSYCSIKTNYKQIQ